MTDCHLPTVFLPGTQCDERVWLPLWQQLDLADRRYVPLQWAETLAQMEALTEYAIDGDRVHLIGFSMGGYIASLAALAQPANIASLTLLGFDGAGLSAQERQQRQGFIRALAKGQGRPMSDSRLAQFVPPGGPLVDQTKATMRDMESDLGPSVLRYQLQATSERKDVISSLSRAPFAVNIIAADLDLIAPLSDLRSMHQHIPNSRLEIIKPCGHMLPLQCPEQLATVLQHIWQQAEGIS